MKKLIFLFAVCFLQVLAFAQDGSFEGNFKHIFSTSISGLDKLKSDARGDAWDAATSLPDAVCAVGFDEEKGLHFFRASYPLADKEAAKALKKSLGDQVEALLPAGDFVRSETYSADCFDYMKTVLDFNTPKFADKKKRPVIELKAIDNEGVRLDLLIYEPYFKNQYSLGK